LALAGGLAGCGSTTAASHRESDQATARAINLAAGDLPPGFLIGPAPELDGGPVAVKLAHCAGAPAPAQVDVVDVSSPTFTAAVGQAQEQLSSEVTMVRTEADGGADLAALRSPRLASCLSTELAPALRAQLPIGSSLGSLTVSHFTPPGDVSGALGLRLRIPVTAVADGASAQVEVTDDLISFLVGRAEITLTARTTGNADQAAPEGRLARLLEQRARGAHQTT
jgi:hypothetical protein